VLLTVVAAVPAAYWGGTGQFRRLAASQPVMSLVLTMVIVVALLADLDVIVAVVVLPAVVNVLGLAYLGRGIPWRGPGVASSLVHEERRALVRLGVAFVLTAMIAVLGQTALRLLVDAHFGRGATGQFQAAFSVAVVQITLILQTLASEYLPRLSGCIGDREAMNGAVQQQVRLTLLLVSPIAIIGIALPELALRLFYSSEFTGAASLMQLLLLGTLFRVVYWVLAFIWVVHERRRVLVAQELAVNALLIATFGVLLTFVGLEAAGIAYLSAHLIVAMATLIQARRFSGFSLGQGDGALLVFLVSASCLLYWLTSTNAPAAVPVALAVAVCAVCGAMLLRMIGLGSLRRYLRSSH
jgi:enterobacterial common antigen flippase